MSRLLISALLGFMPIQLMAQNVENTVEMADALRADGKIYVVVVVMLLLILGMAFYTYRIDKKVSNLEKKVDSDHS